MGQPSTGAQATGWARWVIAASIAVLLAAAVATIVAGDDDTEITRAGTSTTTAPTEQLDAPSSTAAPSGEAAPAEQVPAPTTTAAARASPSTSAAAAPPVPTDHAAPLRDRTFESVSVAEGSAERTFTDGATVRLQFEGTATGDVIRWRIDCNTAGGMLTATADRLTVQETGSSAVSCGEPRDADDVWIGSFFGSDPGWALDGSRLTLRSGDTVITLDEVPAERFGA